MININTQERFCGLKRRRDELVGIDNGNNNSFNNGVPKIMRSGFNQGIGQCIEHTESFEKSVRKTRMSESGI